MRIFNLTCPGCHSADKIEHINSTEFRSFWTCCNCGTLIVTSVATKEIIVYRLKTIHKGIRYEASFYLLDEFNFKFILDYFHEKDKVFCNIVILKFYPTIDANNFAQKLPTLLTFS